MCVTSLRPYGTWSCIIIQASCHFLVRLAENMNDKAIAVRFFQKNLRGWFLKNKRDFPWRHTRNRYYLLIAEMMLRRTRADQVMPIYEQFIRQFPTPAAALRDPSAVEKLLEPLGLKWRAATVLRMLDQIQCRHKGRIPSDPKKLRALDGVGQYVSNAVACFGKGLPLPIVDSNVLRVICRYIGIPHRDSLRRNRSMIELASKLVDPGDARRHNWAMIDLAHFVCRPKNPNCRCCPLQKKCEFYAGSKALGSIAGKTKLGLLSADRLQQNWGTKSG